jgi:hypothetical protein
MKYLSLALIAVNVIISHSTAFAQQESISPTNSDNQAASLITQPATIDSRWTNTINQNDNLKQTAESITVVRSRGCEDINPLEFLSNPGAIFEECQKPRVYQPPAYAEPIDYFKVPRLDSGDINVTVTRF